MNSMNLSSRTIVIIAVVGVLLIAGGFVFALAIPLIFPPEDWVARLHQFRATTAEEETAWSEAFTKAMGL